MKGNNDQLYLDTLKRYFGYDSFRGIQLDIIRSIANGHDTLGLMPTGGGKSITFQVPALTMDGVCLVISPLIALMKDQVEHLKARNIKAEAIYSGLAHHEIHRVLDNAIFGAVKFLYVSPERLTNDFFLTKLQYMKICFIVVDEAHCISQWGYDFRPPYLHIGDLRRELSAIITPHRQDNLPALPILALTATATPYVVKDIQDKLKFSDEATFNVFSMSFRRENLSYVVRHADDKFRELMHIICSVPGSVIVYTRNREKTKKLAEMINAEGVSATFYHAGLDFAIKEKRQELWQKDEMRVMVATNAFGMGIDKPDVRLVIHMDCPDSIEAYFQEAGRAGRDGKRAYAVLLNNAHDKAMLLKRINTSFPEKDYIRTVYDHLAYFFELAVESGEGAIYDFNEIEFCHRFKHFPIKLESALAILQNAGYISYDLDHDNRARVIITVSRNELYDINNLSDAEEKALNALLRNYGTLFTDFTYIDFALIERHSGLYEQALHVTLKSLAQRGIIRYLPAKRSPTITYLRQRVVSERLRITENVYENLREKLRERINKMIEYISETEVCRERMLMEYFGEKVNNDCGRCDICLE